MKKLTIFNYIRDDNNANKILGKNSLRVVSVHESFIGIGDKGQINKAEFQRLADALEPHNEGINIS